MIPATLFTIIFISTLLSTVSCATLPNLDRNLNPNLNVKVKPYSIPYGHYHCQLRRIAYCYNSTEWYGRNHFAKLNDCYNDQTYKLAGYAPDEQCDEDDLACWKTCQNLLKDEKFSADMETPILYSVTYADSEPFDQNMVNLTWSPVEGAALYLIQYLDPADLYTDWRVGSGRPILTMNTYHVFKTKHVCSTYRFRVAAINPSHVTAFSNVMDSPDHYPLDLYLKMNLIDIRTSNFTPPYRYFVNLNFTDKIGMGLKYSYPLKAPMVFRHDDGLEVEKVYIKGDHNLYVELQTELVRRVSWNNSHMYYLLPKNFLSSKNEILFLRDTYTDACGRVVKADTAVKVIFSCDDVIEKSCAYRKDVDSEISMQKFVTVKPYLMRRVIKLDESAESNAENPKVKMFHKKVNISDYTNYCDVNEEPYEEGYKIFALKSYQTITYCGIASNTEDPSTPSSLKDEAYDSPDHVTPQTTGPIVSVSSVMYTIDVDVTSLTCVLKIGLLLLCFIITAAIIGFVCAGYKLVGNDKRNNGIVKKSAEPSYKTMPSSE